MGISTASAGSKSLNILGGRNVSANTTNQNVHDTATLGPSGTQLAETAEENTQTTVYRELQGGYSQSTVAVTRRESISDRISGRLGHDDSSFKTLREKRMADEQHRLSHGVRLVFVSDDNLFVRDGCGKGKLATKIRAQGDLQMYFYGQSHWKLINLTLVSGTYQPECKISSRITLANINYRFSR